MPPTLPAAISLALASLSVPSSRSWAYRQAGRRTRNPAASAVCVALLLAVAAACQSTATSAQTPAPTPARPALSISAATRILGVFRPFSRATRDVYYVRTGEPAAIPEGAAGRSEPVGPPPSGPIRHMVEIIDLPAAETPQTFTLLPYRGETACVTETTGRVALTWFQRSVGNAPEPASVKSGDEAFVVSGSGCEFADLALVGAHPTARLVRVRETHRITAKDIGVLDDIPSVFQPSDVERLARAPEGTWLSRISPEDYVADVPLRISVLWTERSAESKRIWRNGRLVRVFDGPIVSFIVAGERAFIVTTRKQPARTELVPL